MQSINSQSIRTCNSYLSALPPTPCLPRSLCLDLASDSQSQLPRSAHLLHALHILPNTNNNVVSQAMPLRGCHRPRLVDVSAGTGTAGTATSGTDSTPIVAAPSPEKIRINNKRGGLHQKSGLHQIERGGYLLQPGLAPRRDVRGDVLPALEQTWEHVRSTDMETLSRVL